MLSKRIISCLDIKNGRTVKGVNFVGLKDAGDPVDLAEIYSKEGADELIFLDITATNEKRKTLLDLVKRIGERINIRCFKSDPSIKSSLTFLRRTPWARDKVENLYLRSIRK